jgi:hypothetical protein
MAAIVVAPGGDFQVEGEWDALVFQFVPERELLDFYGRDNGVIHGHRLFHTGLNDHSS